MPNKLLVANSVETMIITPLNSFNQIISGFTPSAGQITITDDTSPTPINYPVQSLTWDADTKLGTLTFQTPDGITQSVTKNLTVKKDGVALNVIPNPLTVDIMPPYRGRFILSSAVLAWDFALTHGATISSFYDYSGNNAHAVAFDGTVIGNTSKYTTTPNYKRFAGDTSITLGYKTYCFDQALTAKRPALNANKVNELTEVPSGPVFPARTISFAFILAGLNSTISYNLWNWGIRVQSIFNTSISATVDIDDFSNAYLKIKSGGNIVYSKFIGNGANYDKVLNVVSIVLTPINTNYYSMDIYYGQLAKVTVASIHLDSNAADIGRTLNFCSGGWLAEYVTPFIFEFVMYSDAKSSTFIYQNATAWGIA